MGPDVPARDLGEGLIGVNANQHERIEAISVGDKFVAYISRSRLLDGRGGFTSTGFQDTTPVFGVREVYPFRARVWFDQLGAGRDAKVALWGLSVPVPGARRDLDAA